MKNSRYVVTPIIQGYKHEAQTNLSKDLEKLGLKYDDQADLGGGPGEIISQVVAHITVKDVWIGVASSAIYEIIKSIITTIYKWHKKNKKPDNNVRPFVNIYVYNENKNSFFIECDASKQYSNKDLEKIIDNAEKDNE